MKKYILFDLDGTLLPMDQDKFLRAYLNSIGQYMSHHGYEPKKLVNIILSGTEKMIKNRGDKSNEEVFWDEFTFHYGEKGRADEHLFTKFYIEEFPKLVVTTSPNPNVKHIISQLKKEGYHLVLATNPLYPAVATEARIKWAGLNRDDFLLVTTYENSKASKPTKLYFENILQDIGASLEETLMVGNDTDDDLAFAKLGGDIFFITDTLINKHNVDMNLYPHGSFPDLLAYLKTL